MGFTHPYEGVDWGEDEQHLTQLHTHEPRNAMRADSSQHEPTIDAERVPVDDLGKNNLSPAPDPEVLVRKYRNAGYTVFALTEHEYYVEESKYKTTPYEEMPDRLDRRRWPWIDGDLDPSALDMVALTGTELRGSVDGVLQDVLGLATTIGHGRQEPMEDLLDRIDARDGLAILPHPSKYHAPSEYSAYRPLFTSSEALLGLEVFNGHDRYPSRDLWDRLLTQFGAERPIWAFAGDDYHGRARPRDAKRFDRSRMVLLVPSLSERTVRDALAQGRSYVQYNGEHHAPFVDSIDVTTEAITVRTRSARRIEWIAAGDTVATGDTVLRDRVGDAPYVRAQIHGDGRAVTCTQPFYVD